MKKSIVGFVLIFCCIYLLSPIIYGKCYLFLHRGNSSVENLILKSIIIEYTGGTPEDMSSVFDSAYLQHIDSKPNAFFKTTYFFKVNKSFMNSFKEINENTARVVVTVQDLNGIYFQEMTLSKDDGGNFKISNIQYDT
ncbi:hypothetical protein AAFA46_03615 [Oscillospiraceae bacterium WX1]